ncbi:MAG TPA: hypothetical protein PLI09_01795 [Candidatus Hydrogenedentes bacterium]|nr:hypothetical protein [Candidatus Hydrogenedentota bacterium]
MSVEEIEKGITQLSTEDFAELMAWIEKYHEQKWDEQIEQDVDAGRLDALVAKADKEFSEGLAKPL